MYNLVMIVNNMYGVLEFAKKVDLKSFHHTHTHTHTPPKKKKVTVWSGAFVNYTEMYHIKSSL